MVPSLNLENVDQFNKFRKQMESKPREFTFAAKSKLELPARKEESFLKIENLVVEEK